MHATFYGGRDVSGTTAGACGYKDTATEGHDVQTAVVSTNLFDSGAACDGCYELKCVDSPDGCKTSLGGVVVVTTTNLCPPNYQQSGPATMGWYWYRARGAGCCTLVAASASTVCETCARHESMPPKKTPRSLCEAAG